MRLSLLFIAASSAIAVPLHDFHTRGYDENAVAARNLNNLVARYGFQPLAPGAHTLATRDITDHTARLNRLAGAHYQKLRDSGMPHEEARAAVKNHPVYKQLWGADGNLVGRSLLAGSVHANTS
ncbi:hypothetical protein EIP91_006101 [Steccherinum ochraceum]|uniref:SCP domain-containing protein n=1 Tax=Steccherinum ochraceum TaxID=92696 RepID=A0A4R0REK6_9APHY|nr:hypothetical protein EIP91_006101 [Steccherinum ochraceum]